MTASEVLAAERLRRSYLKTMALRTIMDGAFLILVGWCMVARADPVPVILMWIAVNAAAIRSRLDRERPKP